MTLPESDVLHHVMRGQNGQLYKMTTLGGDITPFTSPYVAERLLNRIAEREKG